MAKNSLLDVSEILTEYVENVQEELVDVATKAGADCVKELKNHKSTYKVRSGDYNKSWTKKVEVGTNFVKVTVYNRKHYRLTHLLENGHATRNGKRTKSYKHIEPIAEKYSTQCTNDMERIIQNGGS